MSSSEAWHSMSQSSTAPQTDIQERLAEVAGRAKNFTSAGGVAIALAAGEQFTTFVTTGTSLEVGAVVPLPTSFGGFRKEKGNVLRCPDTDKEATIDMKACRAARIKSMLIVPIGDLSSVRGVLAVFSSAAHAFTETHVAVLKTLAEVISHLLPEKEKVGELLPEKKEDELLEHPFNPAFDPLPRKVQIGGSDQPDFNQPPSPPPPITPSVARPSTTGSIFAGGATPPQSASKPGLGKNFAPPPLPKSSSLTASKASSAAFHPPTSQGSVLDLASDPIAGGALVKTKRGSGKRTITRSSATTSISNLSIPQERGFDFKKFYTALIAVVALVAVGWGAYGYIGSRGQKRIEQSYIIPPPAASRGNTSVSPTARRPTQPQTNQPALSQPEPIQPAPITTVPIKNEPIHSAPIATAPMKTDVVGSATAGSLPERATVPAPKPQRVAAPQKSESEVLKGQDIIVVSQPSAAALRKLEEETPPQVSVPGSASIVSDVLKSSTAAPTPVLKHSQVVAAVLVSKVAPIYPDQAKRYGLSGKVMINAKVTKTGAVGEVHPVSGNAILSDAAMTAVKKWRYKPATLDGRPVDSSVELTFDFNAPR